jgi:predicted component of type VI protein secretion system
MQPELLILAGAKGMRIRVKLPAVIGRSDEAKLKIRHGRISRRHCALSQRGEECWIEDLHSSNGTFVNGERLAQPRQLVHGDNIRVGDIIFRLELPAETDRPPSPVCRSLVEDSAQQPPASPSDTDAERHEHVTSTERMEEGKFADSIRWEDDVESEGRESLPSFLRYHERSSGSFIGIETGNETFPAVTEAVEIETGDKPGGPISKIGTIVIDRGEKPAESDSLDPEALASFLRGLG